MYLTTSVCPEQSTSQLDVKPFVLDTIFQEQTCPDQPRTMFVKWLEGSPGTGSQSRRWQTVLDAVRMICGSAAMEDIHTAVQSPRIPTAGKSRAYLPMIQRNMVFCTCLVSRHQFQCNRSFCE